MLDGFFVGDGSVQLIEKDMMPLFLGKPDQLTNRGKLANRSQKSFELVDDTSDFFGEEVNVSGSEIRDVWSESKQKIFDVFDYMSVRSKQYQGIPIKLGDLVFGDDDLYVLEEVDRLGISDVYLISSIAQLYAVEQMGFYEFRFYAVHGCPLCHAAHRKHFSTKEVLGVLCSGEVFLHPYCDFDIVPIIRREVYKGAISNLNIDFEINGIYVKSAPVEYITEIRAYLSNLESNVKTVEFLNLPNYCKQNHVENYGGTVSILSEDSLLIHNSYVDNAGPMEFLSFTLDNKKEPDKIPLDELKGEIFFLNGKKVIKFQNHFWNPSTGERIK
jgi:hypothetical protein